MRSDTKIQLIAGVILAACLALSGALTVATTAEAGRAQLGYADTFEQSDPPEVAVGIALGAFRGLFTNVLWIRAQKLKEEGKFYEAIELSRAITRLQPRFPRVWGFHAWNMAYNISVATNTAEERWQWVNAGIKLLRDEGIPKNPNEMQLHRELAWIFIHKIQGINDDANHFYKRRLAREWLYLLGAPPPRGETREESVERFAQRLETIAGMPDTVEELKARWPRTAEIIRRLEAAGLALDFNLLRQTELRRAVAIAESDDRVRLTLEESNRNAAFDEFLQQISADEEDVRGFFRVLAFTRKQQLKSMNYELPRMIRYTRKYGPLDWRHPATHALYWATRGVEEGLERVNTQDFDQVNTDRIITHAIQELFRWGQVYFDPVSDGYVQMLDLDWAETYGRILTTDLRDRASRRRNPAGGADAESEDRHFTLFGVGYENFVRDLVRIYWRMGDRAQAEKWFEELRTGEWRNSANPVSDTRELSVTLPEFIENDMKDRYTSPEVAASEVYATLMDSYLRGLLQGDRKIFIGGLEYANKVHEHYMREQMLRTTADPNARRMEFMPRRFVDAAANALILTLQRGDIPIWRQSRMYRMVIGSPFADVGRAAYEQLLVAAKPTLPDFDEWFPEPPGMEEYRAKRRALDEQSDVQRLRQVESRQQ